MSATSKYRGVVETSHPRFYSQCGEDGLLWHFFQGAACGFYIDVGAFDGRCISNTMLFEELGWDGICVEANRKYLELCRSNRPRATCIHAACVGDATITEIDLHVDDAGLFAGLDPETVLEAKRHYLHYNIPFSDLRTHRVPALTLNHVIKRHVPDDCSIDLLSIDVEGAEPDVLKGLDLNRIRPRVIVAEANTAEARDELKTILGAFGYSRARSLGVNEFFVCSADDVQRMRAVAFQCRLDIADHPLGEPYTTLTKMNNGSVSVEAETNDALT